MNIIKLLLNFTKIKGYILSLLSVVEKVNAVLEVVETELKDYENISLIKEAINAINALQKYLDIVRSLMGLDRGTSVQETGDAVTQLNVEVSKLRRA